MTSRHNFAGEKEVRGRWTISGSRVALSSPRGGRSFRWFLEIVRHAETSHLVPEETLEIYHEDPSNLGSRYRRVSANLKPELGNPKGGDGEDNSLIVKPATTPAVSNPDVSPIEKSVKVRGANAGASSQVSRPIAATTTADATKASASSSTPRATSLGKTVFVSMPASSSPLDFRGLDEGLARLSLDERGYVTAVKILRSTGRQQVDSEAIDTFRRWRANPGRAREVEMPISSIRAGKPMPFRVPTTSGSMTSG